MKTEADIERYLTEAGGDLEEAFRIACREHHPGDQTLDMKKSMLMQAKERGAA